MTKGAITKLVFMIIIAVILLGTIVIYLATCIAEAIGVGTFQL